MALRSVKGLLLLVVAVGLLGGCARSPEAKKARYLERGERYFKQQQYREAIIEYRNALRIDNNNAQAIRQLGLAHFQLGQAGQAFRFLLKAHELEPDNADITLKLAGIYLLGGRPDDARSQAERVLQKDPGNLDALILWSGAANTPEELASSISHLEKVRAHFDNQARYHLGLANLYRRKGDSAGAERELQTAAAREPNSVEANLELGNFYAVKRNTADAERYFKAAASLAPAGSATQLRLADFYLFAGRPEDAKRVLGEVTSKAPDYLPAWRRQAELALSERRLDDAEKALGVVLKKDAGDLDAHLLRGRVLLTKPDVNAAIQELQIVLKAEPRFAPGRYYMGLARLQAGDVQQAKTELKDAVSLSPNYVEAAVALARLNLQTGAVPTAIQDLEQLLTKQPRLIPAYVLLSGAYLSQQKASQGAEVARRLIAVAPQDPRGPDLLGLNLAVQGKRVEARREFEKSLTLSPAYLDPLSHLVSLGVAEKQVDEAIARVKKQIAAIPPSGAHQALLGEAYLQAQNLKLAEEAYLKAIELEPRLFSPYIRLGTLYTQAGQYDRALARLDPVIKRNPNDPTPLFLTGTIYEAKGDVPKARDAYEKALKISPRFAAAANNLAWIYSEHGGDKDRALQLAQTAKEQAPDDPRISDTLGWILYKRGVYQRALALLKESADKIPANPQVQYHLGMAYRQVGERDNARKALQMAVSSPQTFAGKDEARTALADLR